MHTLLSRKRFTVFFVAKTIYALRPECFCVLKVEIRKVQTFWASALHLQTMIDIKYNFRSVLTFFGVNEVFENAIRAALCARLVFPCDSIPFAWA